MNTIYNFTTIFKANSIVASTTHFTAEKGYGLVTETSFYPYRKLDLHRVEQTTDGIEITENKETIYWKNENDYNYGGLVFRISNLTPGAYHVAVTTTSPKEITAVSINSMNPYQILDSNLNDPIRKDRKIDMAYWEENTWHYEYVTGCDFLEIEVEPLLGCREKPATLQTVVGLKEISITKLEKKYRNIVDKKTIYLLGDSTVKSYNYEEAIMSGWGQIFSEFFNLEKINITNCSMGGRSVKSMYQEGRFNKILRSGKSGDYLLIQSGHNDESTGEEKGPNARFGRGNTDKTYDTWIRETYIPAIKAMGMIPILVTPMTRIDSEKTKGKYIEMAGFGYWGDRSFDFPSIMKNVGKECNVSVIDLHKESILYLNGLDGEAANAIFLSVEAGETPGKTNSGSYANGHPGGVNDGTHFKEALAKQFAKIVTTELAKLSLEIQKYLKVEIKNAIINNDWSKVFYEIAKDIEVGENAYYRDQIEKLIKIGVFHKDKDGYFYPKKNIRVSEFIEALCKTWDLNSSLFTDYTEGILTNEVKAAIIIDGYTYKFGKNPDGTWIKPPYMTNYNGTSLSPTDINYDPNLVGESAQYYPLIPWGKLSDTQLIDLAFYQKVEEAYQLGLIRSECGIVRGKMVNGTLLEPQKPVSREKAAKGMWFLWVLSRDIHEKNHEI
ncbi:MAG: hypothetical protein GX913_05200 [Clostridiales bacterium]|nr:hypothetical protein [Clostridiales bacterium]